MSLTYARENLATAKAGILSLLEEHWLEMRSGKSGRKLDPDFEIFEGLERKGHLFILTVRQDGVMVGYAAAIIHHQLHSKGTKAAMVDAIFLTKSARQGRVGINFLKYVDLALSSLADAIYWHIKPERDFAPVLKRLVNKNYTFVESIYSRRVVKESA